MRGSGGTGAPGGVIELPGEAAPLTPQQIFQALQNAASSNQQMIQTGAQQLQTWESQEGYYTLLQVWNSFRRFVVAKCGELTRYVGCILRQNFTNGDSLPRNHTIEEWH